LDHVLFATIAISYIIVRDSVSHITSCPSCNTNESWETLGHPCLACQMATIVFCNPFSMRFQQQLEKWLHNSNSESSDGELEVPICQQKSTVIQSEHEMLQRRNRTIEKSFQEIKKKATSEQTRYIFENLSILKHTIQSNCANLKRGHTSQTDSSITSTLEPDILTPRKRSTSTKKSFQENSTISSISQINSRSPR
jgi:hypothetical protein